MACTIWAVDWQLCLRLQSSIHASAGLHVLSKPQIAKAERCSNGSDLQAAEEILIHAATALGSLPDKRMCLT